MEKQELLDKIQNTKESLLADEYEDLDRLENRTGAMNQRFTVHFFAMNELGKTQSNTKYFRNLLSNDNYDLDLKTVRKLAADKFEGQVEMYSVRYDLENTAELLGALSEHVRSIESEDEFAELMKDLQELFNYFTYQIADRIPWHDLAVAFEGRKVLNKELRQGRLEYDHQSHSKTLR